MKLIVSQMLVINNYPVFAIYKSTASIHVHVHVHVGPRCVLLRQNQYSLIAFLVFICMLAVRLDRRQMIFRSPLFH